MILIKDRHILIHQIALHNNLFGNYDTYKGSTLRSIKAGTVYLTKGNYDTYKGSTRSSEAGNLGSPWGTMILIKDRHTS